MTSHYRDLAGTDYVTKWTLDPLKVEGAMNFGEPHKKGVHELVNVAERINRKLPPR